MKKITSLIITSFLVSYSGISQSILEEYISLGIRNNQTYLKETLQTKIAIEDSKSAKSLFFPDVTFDASYTLADGGRTIDFPLGDLFNPAYTALNQLTESNQFPTDIQNVSVQLLPNDFHETKIRVLQPILNTDIYYGYKASKANITSAQAKQKSYENELVFEITKAYYNHLQLLEQRTILDSTRIVLKELVRVNKKFVKYDIATKEVLYNAKAQLDALNASIATVHKNINTSRTFFNFLLNRNLEEKIIPITPEIITVTSSELSLEFAKDSALKNRSELQQISAGIEAQEYLVKKEKNYLIPDIAVGSEIGYQGFGYTFRDNQDYYLVNFNLKWSIFKGGRNKSKIRKAQLQKEQLSADYTLVTKQIQLEVTTAFYELEEALKIYESRRSQLKNVEENFKIISQKYHVNQVLLVQFNEARNNLTTSQINTSIAKFNIAIAKANLKKTLQTTN